MDPSEKGPMAALRHRLGSLRKDMLLFHVFPNVYRKACMEPIDEKKVVFVETRATELTDNFKLIYEELEKNYNFDLHVSFLNELHSTRSEYKENCKKMLMDIATAKYVFLNDACDVVSCVDKREGTLITQVWHACGAFKRFGMSTADRLFGSSGDEIRRHPYYGNLDYVTVSSPEVVWAYAQAMDLEDRRETIVPCGVSRTDYYFKEDFRQKAFDDFYNLFPAAKGKKVILFAPTFRGSDRDAKTATAFDPALFYPELKDDYVIVTKHHPFVKSLPTLPKELEGSFIMDMTRSMPIEQLLIASDICISDYSSLIYEYSLMLKPMIFFAYDLGEYYDWRGFYYDYDELTPGPVFRTNEEIIDFIKHIDERFDKDQVKAFRERFMSACDGHVTQRLLKMVFGDETLMQMRRERAG